MTDVELGHVRQFCDRPDITQMQPMPGVDLEPQRMTGKTGFVQALKLLLLRSTVGIRISARVQFNHRGSYLR